MLVVLAVLAPMDIVTQIVVVLQAVIIIVQPHYPGLFTLYLELGELYLVLYVFLFFSTYMKSTFFLFTLFPGLILPSQIQDF